MVFFIRASVKNRIQAVQLLSAQPPDALRQSLLAYLGQRGYSLSQPESGALAEAADAGEWLELRGWVRPSVFLAIFLALLAAIGLFCLALVLLTLFPGKEPWFLGLLLLSPLAAGFYWRKAGREESVAFNIVPSEDLEGQSRLTFKGHRDEIAQLKANLPFKTSA